MSMTSQTSVTTSCSACGACQGYTYGTYILASNLTDPDGDDGDDAGLDDDDATSDDEDDGTTGTKKRSFVRRKGRYQAGSGEPHKGRGLAGRFSIQDPKPTLVKRGKTTNTVGGCNVGHDYQAKPPYPNAQSVQAFEGIQKNGYTRMSGFYQTAAYWAVPSDVPLETCDTPTWSYKKTVEIQAIKNPGPWQFKAVAGNRYVDIDHVYEAKFLTDFMGNLVRTGQRSCPAINNEWGVLAGEEPRSIPAGAPGGKLKGQLPTRLNVLFSMLASFDHPEFVGMASPMNTLKGLVTNWRWSPPVKITGTAFDLDALGDLFILLDVYNTDIVLSLWEITNARIYAAFQSFDTQTKPACNSENQFLYAPVYKDWITNRIATMNQNLQSFITSALKGVPTNDQIVAERLSSLTAKYPAARMTIPSPRYWTPKDPNSPIVNGVVNWGQAAQPGGLDKRANSGACLSSKDSSISTSAASGGTVSNGNKIPFGTGNININGLGLAKTLASPRRTPMIMTTLTSSPTLPTTTPPTSSPYTITTPTSSPALPATSPLTSSALPVATSATASTSAAAAISSNGDPCGPAKQEPGFQSTCSTSVSLATTPQQYGVYCGVSVNTVLQHTACETAYKTLCENIQWSGFPTGAWVWSDPGRGCAAGVWIPSYDGAAMIPSLERCTDLIYQAMVQSCQPDVITSNFAGIVASVNLATLPSFDDVTQTGSQLNVGYPSYMIAPKSPVGLSETWAGWTTGQAGSEGALAGMNPHDQDITPQAYKVPDDTITA